jgi:hypothetical protein
VHDGPGIDRGKRASNTLISFAHKYGYTNTHRVSYTFGNSNGNRYRDALAHASTEAFSHAYGGDAN